MRAVAMVRGIAAVAAITLGVGGVAGQGSPMLSVAGAIPEIGMARHAATSSCVTPPAALVPCARAIPGFIGQRLPLRSVLAVAPRQVDHVLQSASGEAVSFAWVASNGHGRLLVAAWHLKNGRTAARELAAWRTAVAKHHPVSLKSPNAGFRLRAGGAKAPALAVVRVGPVVAAVLFQTSARGTAIDDFLSGEAETESEQISGAISQTGYELLSYKVSKHHGPTRSLALEAFALIGGKGPGVPRPPTPAGFIAGTQALDWVIEELPHFSKAQRRAVGNYLARTFPPHASPPPPANGVARAAGAESASDYQTIANEMLARIETHTGPLGINPIVNKATPGVPGDYAETSPYRSCSITVYPDTDSLHPWEQQHTLAHELGHCMQHKYNAFGVTSRPSWLLDGPPEWIADQVVPIPAGAGGSSPAVSPLYDYDNQIGDLLDGLFTGYEGAGFLGHVADQAGENTIWARMPQIMVQTDTAGGLAATVGSNAQEVYDTWGGSYAQRTDLGLNWERINPYPGRPSPPTDPHAKHVIVPDGTVPLPAPAQTGQLYRVDTTQPFLRIDPQGHLFGRLADTAGKDVQIQQTAGRIYCAIGTCDSCPPGTEGTPPPSQPLTMPLLIGLSGGTPPGTGGIAVVTGEPWSNYCHSTTPPPPPPRGGGSGTGGVGGSGGDPHLLDFDGSLIDFQGAGEFTLLKSTQDDFEVQVRQEPFTGSGPVDGSHSVSVNTAVAMRVGSATVEVDALRRSAVAVYVNKLRVHGPDISLGRGRLTVLSDGATVTWPDGSFAEIFNQKPLALGVEIRLARHRLRRVEGLLGNWGARASAEFVGRDGRHYPQGVIVASDPGSGPPTASDRKVLYKQFGGSWRITQGESLFRYARGKSTRSYTIPGFPSQDLTAATLPPAARGAGQTACTAAAITNGQVFAGCELDVGATGDAGFATGDRQFQTATGLPASAGGVSPIPWTQLSSQPDNDIILVPSLASQGSQMVAAYQHSRSSIEVGTFTPTATEVSALSRVNPITGWTELGDPVLFPRPGGGLQMIFSGLQPGPFNASTSGTVVVPRNGDGSFAAPVTPAAGGFLTNLLRGAVLASDGLPLWTEYSPGGLQVYHGASAATSVNLNFEVPGTSYIATLAYDRSGRLWLAWYVSTSNLAANGLYMLQLDPSTGNAAVGATPLLVPDSQTSNNNDAQPAVACAQSCRIVYQDSRSSSRLLSWAPGDQAPTTVTTDPTGPAADPTAAYATNGGLWITWTESSSGHPVAKLGDGYGSGGAQVELPSPAGYDRARYSAAVANGTQLVLVTNWQSYASPNTAVFATVVNAPERRSGTGK